MSTTPRTTLEDELMLASIRVKCPSYTMCFGCPGCALSDTLRQRAALVRELEAEIKGEGGASAR